MAISYSYPMGTPKLTDTVLGVQYEEMKDPAVKNFSIDDIVTLAIEEAVIPTLQEVTAEGANTTIQMQINGVDVATLDDIPEPSYKVYVALLTQSGILDPNVTELENTIGPITIARTSTGFFRIASSGLFTLDKTTFDITPIQGFIKQDSLSNINTISFETRSTSDVASDGLLGAKKLEIRVYN